MPYNLKQYSAALDFLVGGDDNIVAAWDKKRVQAYDLYENLYINSTYNLKLVLRGSDQTPMLMPSGRKIIEATNRFLGLNLDYLVEGQGDAGLQQNLDDWWAQFFKREALRGKFASNKRWGLIRGDAMFYVYAEPGKDAGTRLSIIELDPRQVFYIEDPNNPMSTLGVYIVDTVQDFREPDKPEKKLARRRAFRKQDNGTITSDLTFWTLGKWDDRNPANDLEKVPGGDLEEPEAPLPDVITALPVYHWKYNAPQNSSWGHSQLTGLETLMYGINQSLTDEDATIVFQGLGMYVTTSAPPVDPTTGELTDWNIGPMQIIEIGTDQTFQRVTGVSDVSPYQNHMNFIDEKGLSEAAGVPATAIGRVDVNTVQSGISLKMEMMPLLAANSEKELEMIVVLDQMFHDITTMWLPAYETETFGNATAMAEMSVVSIFDDPMPVDRDAKIQETILLQTSNLILTSMAVGKLRDLGWNFPTVDPYTGEPLDDHDIADMLAEQANAAASVGLNALGGDTGNVDANGNPIDPNAPPDPNANGQAPQAPQAPTVQKIPLGK